MSLNGPRKWKISLETCVHRHWDWDGMWDQTHSIMCSILTMTMGLWQGDSCTAKSQVYMIHWDWSRKWCWEARCFSRQQPSRAWPGMNPFPMTCMLTGMHGQNPLGICKCINFRDALIHRNFWMVLQNCICSVMPVSLGMVRAATLGVLTIKVRCLLFCWQAKVFGSHQAGVYSPSWIDCSSGSCSSE